MAAKYTRVFGTQWKQKKTTSRKTGKTKKKNFRVFFEGPPIMVLADSKPMANFWGAILALMIRLEMAEAAKRYQVKDTTVQRRRRALRDGKSRSYKRKYAGGRTGHLPPMHMHASAWGIDSGRTFQALRLRLRKGKKKQSFGILETAANRFGDPYFGDAGQIGRHLQRMRDRVPLLRGSVKGRTGVLMKQMLHLLVLLSVAENEAKAARKGKKMERMGQVKPEKPR